MNYLVTVNGEAFEIEIGREGRVWVNHHSYDVDFRSIEDLAQYLLLVNHRSYEVHVETESDETCRMVIGGRLYHVCLQQHGRGRRGDGQTCVRGMREVRAPLPGLLVAVPVETGQRVARGDVLAVVESMKMNLELRAPQDGVVQALYGTPGAEVNQEQVLAIVAVE